jgi:hypothetical protein
MNPTTLGRETVVTKPVAEMSKLKPWPIQTTFAWAAIEAVAELNLAARETEETWMLVIMEARVERSDW